MKKIFAKIKNQVLIQNKNHEFKRWLVQLTTLTVLSTLLLGSAIFLNNINKNLYTENIQIYLEIEEINKTLDELSTSIELMHEPGNRVLSSTNYSLEFDKLKKLQHQVEENYFKLKQSSKQLPKILPILSILEIKQVIDKYNQSSGRVFEYVKKQKRNLAIKEMSEMDLQMIRTVQYIKSVQSNLLSYANDENRITFNKFEKLEDYQRLTVSIFILLMCLSMIVSMKFFKQIQKKSFEDTKQLIWSKRMISQFELAEKIGKMGSWKYSPDTKTLIWSKQMYQIFDISPDRNGDKLIDEFKNKVYVADRKQLFEKINDSIIHQNQFEHEFRIVLGESIKYLHIAVEINEVKITDDDIGYYALNGIVTDMTEKKVNEEKVLKQTKLIQSLFDQSRLPMLTLDWPDLKIKSLNKAALELIGYSSEEDILGKSFHLLSPENQSNGVSSAYNLIEFSNNAFSSQESIFEWNLFGKNKAIIPCSVILSKVVTNEQKLLHVSITDLTALKSKENELRQTIMAVNSAALVSITDRAGKILDVNEQFCSASGYSKKELLGKDHSFISSGLESKSHIQSFWETIKSGNVWIGDFRNKRKDGSIFIVKSMIAPLRNLFGEIERFVSIRFDVTEQKNLQFQMEEAQAVAKIGSWKYVLNNKSMTWSKQMFEIFYQTKISLNGVLYEIRSLDDQKTAPELNTFIEKMHSEMREEWQRRIEDCITKAEPLKMRFKMDSNEPFWIEAYAHANLSSVGEIISISGTCQDITEQVLAQELIEKERMKSVQSAKLASLGEMSAGIAHEINNPLTVISGSIGLLKKYTDDPEKFDRKTESIDRAVQRISKIVNGLRKFSRTTDSEERATYSIAEIIKESLIMTEAKSNRHSISVNISVQNESLINCNNVEIEQVIINLINNGIDAVKDIEERWVKVNVFDQQSEVVIQVIDSGKGISFEVEDKLFQPFFTTKPVGEGTGLGLSICKGILDRHEAKFFLNRSVANTCFEIRFVKSQESIDAA